jgi:hypothetical protein
VDDRAGPARLAAEVAGAAVRVGFDLTFVGESTLVGVRRDDLDVEHVRVFPFNDF